MSPLDVRDSLHAEHLARTSTDLDEKVRMQRLMMAINTRAISVSTKVWGIRAQVRARLAA